VSEEQRESLKDIGNRNSMAMMEVNSKLFKNGFFVEDIRFDSIREIKPKTDSGEKISVTVNATLTVWI